MSISSIHSEVAGHVSALGMIHAVEGSSGEPTIAKLRRYAEQFADGPLSRFRADLERYCALPASESLDLRDRVVLMDDRLYEPEALNMWLSLFSARPKPAYPFVGPHGVDRVALLHPFLRSSRELIGGVVMLRLFCGSRVPGESLWSETERFLAAVWSSEPCGTQLARTSMLSALSDKVYSRTELLRMATGRDELNWGEKILGEIRAWILASSAGIA